MARGKLVIVGYTMWGFALIFMGLTASVPFAVGLAFASGVANMIYIIPSQTMFQERVPPELLGRVVGLPVRSGVRRADHRGRDRRCRRAGRVAVRGRCCWPGILPLAAGLGGCSRAPCERPDAYTFARAHRPERGTGGVVLREWITRMTIGNRRPMTPKRPVDVTPRVRRRSTPTRSKPARSKLPMPRARPTPQRVGPTRTTHRPRSSRRLRPLPLPLRPLLRVPLVDLGDRLRPHVRRPAVTPSEHAVHIDDRISAIYVIAAVAAFVAIFGYALLGGTAGLITGTPTPVALAQPDRIAVGLGSPSASHRAPVGFGVGFGLGLVASASASPSVSPPHRARRARRPSHRRRRLLSAARYRSERYLGGAWPPGERPVGETVQRARASPRLPRPTVRPD
jgi:hypothetical protein